MLELLASASDELACELTLAVADELVAASELDAGAELIAEETRLLIAALLELCTAFELCAAVELGAALELCGLSELLDVIGFAPEPPLPPPQAASNRLKETSEQRVIGCAINGIGGSKSKE